MGVKIKLLAACTAVCAVATAVCFAAYIPQISRSFGASVSGEGVNAAQSYMSLSVTPPSGDEGGISPLILDYTIDCAALAANVGAERVTLTAVVRYADGVDCTGVEDVAYAAHASAQCTASAQWGEGDVQPQLVISCTGQGAQTVLTICVTFTPPTEGECKVNVSLSLGGGSQTVQFFAANSSKLFTVESEIFPAA